MNWSFHVQWLGNKNIFFFRKIIEIAWELRTIRVIHLFDLLSDLYNFSATTWLALFWVFHQYRLANNHMKIVLYSIEDFVDSFKNRQKGMERWLIRTVTDWKCLNELKLATFFRYAKIILEILWDFMMLISSQILICYDRLSLSSSRWLPVRSLNLEHSYLITICFFEIILFKCIIFL